MKIIMYRLIVVLCVLTLFGCPLNKPLKMGDTNSIQSFSLTKEVTVPDKADFIGGIRELIAPGLGAIGGAIGGLIGSAEHDNDVTFTKFLNSNHINIGNIVYTRFVNHIQRHPRYAKKYKEDGALTAHLSVLYYSFVQKNAFSKYYFPGLLIKVQFKDGAGNVIAEGRGDAGAFNSNLPEETMDNINKNPKRLEEMFSSAADEAIRGVLGEVAP